MMNRGVASIAGIQNFGDFTSFTIETVGVNTQLLNLVEYRCVVTVLLLLKIIN